MGLTNIRNPLAYVVVSSAFFNVFAYTYDQTAKDLTGHMLTQSYIMSQGPDTGYISASYSSSNSSTEARE